MAAVKINRGTIEAIDSLEDVPRGEWATLLRARRGFVRVHMTADCRRLLQFEEEAKQMYETLGFSSVDDLLKRGLEIDPTVVRWAKLGLEAIGTKRPVPLGEAVALGQHGGKREGAGRPAEGKPRGNQDGDRQLDSKASGTTADYIKARLRRDGHAELARRVDDGQLSARQAGIQAGFIKPPDPVRAMHRAIGKALPPPPPSFEGAVAPALMRVRSTLKALAAAQRVTFAYELIRIAEETLSAEQKVAGR